MDSPLHTDISTGAEHNKYKRARSNPKVRARGAEEENEKNKSGRREEVCVGTCDSSCCVCACLHMGEVETLMPVCNTRAHLSDCGGPGLLYFTWWSIKHRLSRSLRISWNFSLIFIAPCHKKMHADKCARAPIAVFKQMPFSRGKRLLMLQRRLVKLQNRRRWCCCGWITSGERWIDSPAQRESEMRLRCVLQTEVSERGNFA